MAAAPLTHHEIMSLMPPFTRGGWRVDLAASDRTARQIVLQPAAGRARTADTADTAATLGAGPDELAAAPSRTPSQTSSQTSAHANPAAPWPGPVQERLELACPRPGRFRLTRVLTPANGPAARLQAQGTDAAALLAQVAAVPAARAFHAGPGWQMALDFEVDSSGNLHLQQGVAALPQPTPADAGGPAGDASQAATATAPLLTLTLRMPGSPRRGADLVLRPGGEHRPALPEDVLAVLGWNWARLVADRQGWTTRLRLPWRRTRRPAFGEAALQRAAQHLAGTLAAPPAQYHRRHRLARWGVFLRRGIPTFNALALIGTALAMTQLDLDVDRAPGLWVALYHVPTLLVALSFYAQELARFEFPPLPRALAAQAWGSPEPKVDDPASPTEARATA
jgi:hypothetical protein